MQAISNSQDQANADVISIAAPILTTGNQVIGALSIATSTSRHTLDDLQAFHVPLVNTAKRIGAEAELWHCPSLV